MPGKTVGGGLGNLPPENRSFIGREIELARLVRELGDPAGSRTLTLVGVGGVGKTRLALHAAARARAAYPDGVWLVELSALHTAGLVPLAVMEALRLADQTTDSATAAVAAWARDKRLLLILDSCEFLPDDCAALAADLTAAAPGLRVLTTSRARPALPGERLLTVDPLPVSDPEDEKQADADTLFAERARSVVPGFELGPATRRQVAAVCRGLDGIPLAIELAAARLSELTLDELHTRLGARASGTDRNPAPGSRTARLDLLTSDTDEGQPRHRALRTTIGWSHELCAPLERLLWARLSVFAGGFRRDAATWVCSGGPLPADRVAGLLDRLAARSIVRHDGTARARYRMLDTVREYGADWLRELGEEQAVRDRHRDHYRRQARQAWAEWNTGRQAGWSAWVLTEHANLRAAMDYALDGPDRGPALEMAGDIGFLWRHCDHLRDAQHCLDRLLAEEQPPGEARTRALWVRGAVAIMQGDLRTAADHAVLCADSAREDEDPVAQAAAEYLRGTQLLLSGHLAEAVDVLAAPPRLPVRDDGFGAVQFQTTLTLAMAHQLRGENDTARALAVEVRTDCAERDEHWSGSVAEYLIAQDDLARGDARAAARNARTAIAKQAPMRNIVAAAATLDLLAAALAAAGEPRRAARLLGIGSRIWELTGGDRLNSPDLIAARRTNELHIRNGIGDEVYARAYAEGRAMSYEEGLAYAASDG
ncbi:hypothetical protein GCM10022403_063220 [Streptomyces coacervatus]|uniref:NB-ARC domain-containing protein n=1 Tax=Streptomyces coacervatus TaxID=647381 RepID=A0ABP7IKV2_9ACTN|nr:hypothetical protein [Streptomyces coacervatus]MDF2268871.1 hypothetical protein [Streptomyces coacervatus]